MNGGRVHGLRGLYENKARVPTVGSRLTLYDIMPIATIHNFCDII